MPKCKSPQRRCCLVAGWEKTDRLPLPPSSLQQENPVMLCCLVVGSGETACPSQAQAMEAPSLVEAKEEKAPSPPVDFLVYFYILYIYIYIYTFRILSEIGYLLNR